jgi:N-acetylneuraminic acid mutarotase
LLITNFSEGDDLTRIKLSSDGLSVVDSSSFIAGFSDPLPIQMGPNGAVLIGEFNGGVVTILYSLGAWRTDLPTVPQAILDAGSSVINGSLYLVGGKTFPNGIETHLSTMYIYNPGDPNTISDELWTLGPDLPGPAVENPAVAALGGKLYVLGGATAAFSGAVNNATVFDPNTNVWTTLEPMDFATGGATAQILNGNIYVVGGMDTTGASLNTVQVYNPTTNTWSAAPSMVTRRDNPGSAVIDDPTTLEIDPKLYVFGGRTRNADGSVANPTLSSMEIYDPLTNQWSSGTSMPTGRRTMSVGTLNNKIQVIGGEATIDGTTFIQNEEYNPLTQTWRSLPSIPTGVHGAAFGTIDNVIYVAGGGPIAGSSATDAVQAFTF